MKTPHAFKVPFVDLKAQYRSLKPEIDRAIKTVISETAFISGKYAARFESEFAKAYGVKHCVSCANGTDAIYITLKCLGIGAEDEVITTALSWISTAETIVQAGAKPVFVDIEKDYFNINPDLIEAKITPRTRAVMPVHLYGQPAAMDKIKKICDRHKLYLIEDCAQAHFAEQGGRKAGTFGIAATFSFYPGKNLGAYGDAGAILTNDEALARRMRMYANHGALVKHQHDMPGINSRMDGIQAAVLLAKLPHIQKWNRQRARNAGFYEQALKNIPQIKTPKAPPDSTSIFHLYVIRTPQREQVQEILKNEGIETAIHYPVALPFMKAFADLRAKPEDYPVAARYQHEILSLPMYPELSKAAIQRIARVLEKAF